MEVWYSYVPFDDPKRLRNAWPEVGERFGKHIAVGRSQGQRGRSLATRVEYDFWSASAAVDVVPISRPAQPGSGLKGYVRLLGWILLPCERRAVRVSVNLWKFRVDWSEIPTISRSTCK